MRQGDLFRIRHILVAIVFVLFAHGPATAMWLDVKGATYAVVAPLDVAPEPPKPPQGVTRQGLFALPAYGAATPRLKLQYRAEFPLSVTVETDGAVTVDDVAAGGAVNLTTKIILADEWWVPQLNASLGGVNLEGAAHGRLEAGQSRLRTEWKVAF